MNKYIFLLLFWLCSITICNGQSQDFNDTVKLDNISSLSNVFWQTSDISFSKGWLFVQDQKTDYLIQVYSPEDGKKVYEFGRRGRGPAEYQSFTIQRGPGSGFIEVSDVINNKNDIYDVNCLQQKPAVSETYKCIVKSIPTVASHQALLLNNDNLVLNSGATPNSPLFVSKGKQTLNYLAEIPPPILEKYTNPTFAAMAMRGRIAANRDRTKFAYFAYSFDWALFFQRDEEEMKLIHEHKFSFLPEFTVQSPDGRSGFLTQADDYRTAFRYPVSGENHYFVLYSGKSAEDVEKDGSMATTFTNKIKVFDWDGNEVKEIILDRNISIFTVSYDETMLYGITFNEDFEATVLVGNLKD